MTYAMFHAEIVKFILFADDTNVFYSDHDKQFMYNNEQWTRQIACVVHSK